MHDMLKRFIAIAGSALETEDRFFLGAVAANQIAYPNGTGGILRINNERYYQFIIARALTSSFPYPVEVEVETHDLIMSYPNDPKKWFAVVEMKRWMSASGEREIIGIARDIDMKLKSNRADHRLMLVLSANPPKTTIEQLGWLAKRLGISTTEDPTVWEYSSFPTINTHGEAVEFWVAGHELNCLCGDD